MVRADAIQLLSRVPAEALEPVIPRLRELCLKSSDSEGITIAALQIVRWCGATGHVEPVPTLAATMSYNYALFDALRDAADLGVDVWPLVQSLLPVHADRLDQVLGRVVQKTPKRLSELPHELAMKTVFRAGLWQGAALAPFAEAVITTYLREEGATKEAAARALNMAAAQPAPLPTEKLEERLAVASGDESHLLARVIVLERTKRGLDVEPVLTDSRPLVRLGAYEALSRNAASWPRLLEGLLDSDPKVRACVFDFARPEHSAPEDLDSRDRPAEGVGPDADRPGLSAHPMSGLLGALHDRSLGRVRREQQARGVVAAPAEAE